MKVLLVCALMLFPLLIWSQTQRLPLPVIPPAQDDFVSNRPSNTPTSLAGEEYRIGRDDLVEVAVFEVPELGAIARVTASGTISLPLVGPVRVAGNTLQEVERSVEEALKKNSLN